MSLFQNSFSLLVTASPLYSDPKIYEIIKLWKRNSSLLKWKRGLDQKSWGGGEQFAILPLKLVSSSVLEQARGDLPEHLAKPENQRPRACSRKALTINRTTVFIKHQDHL